ncbi:MAG TPA: amidohydrolase family protein [Candidatus Polarisedimenticolia bacterium]
MTRTLIRGGTLVDGTGAAPRLAELLIEADRIVDLLDPGAAPPDGAGRVIEATGRVVCPGFIDIHSHGDLIHALPPGEQRALMAGRISQGITTEIVGNCGMGVFPRTDHSEGALRGVAAWMTPAAIPGGDPGMWPWSDLESYLSHLEANGLHVNVGTLQPHGPLRIEAAGLDRDLPGTAGAEGISMMSRRLEAALDAGAFGLSTGLIYPPGIYARTSEIIELARVLGRRCAGTALVASHIRGSSETLLPAVEELLEVGRAAGVRVQHSHSEAVGPDHWAAIDRVLEMEEAGRRSGVAVAFDMFPYTAAATMMLAIYPPWALQGGVDRLLARLADPATRDDIRDAIEKTVPSWPPWGEGGWPHNLVKAVGWDRITVGSVGPGANRGAEGMSLRELGRARGASPFDAVSDLMMEERGAVSQIIHGISGSEDHQEGIETLLAHPAGAICTDANDFGKGKPHPAAYGTCPLVLSRWVRERRLLTIEVAVHKMTGYPATLLGLPDRGVVRRGAFADLVVFDPATIGTGAGFGSPRVTARGIDLVLINGAIAFASGASGEIAGEPSGRVLRRGGG